MAVACIKCGFPEENHVPGVRHTFAPKFPPGTISEHRQGSAYLPEEVRTTSSTGGEKGTKPETFAFIPVKPLMAVARIYGKGAEKYDETPDKPNWRKGYEYSKSYNSALRHLMSFWNGEDMDPEMKESHLAAVVFHCFSLMVFQDEHPEFDDRYKPEIKETTADIVMASMREALNDDMLAQNRKAFEEFGR